MNDWRTGDGEELNRINERGADLAELQRQRGTRRDRPSVAAQREQEESKRRKRLEGRAKRSRVGSAAQSIITDRRLHILVGVVVAALIVWQFVLPAVRSALNPPLDRSDLNQSLAQIDLAAAKKLRGDSQAKITDAGDGWMLTYQLRRGQQTYSGRAANRTCTVIFFVPNRPKDGKLVWQNRGFSCR